MNIINFASPECRRILGYLMHYLNGELLVETNIEILNHLGSCDPCAFQFEGQLKVKSSLKGAFARQSVPDILAKRIQYSIRRKRASGLDRAISFVSKYIKN